MVKFDKVTGPRVHGKKHNESDSEESENEQMKALSEKITQTKSRRKMSIDELEKDW